MHLVYYLIDRLLPDATLPLVLYTKRTLKLAQHATLSKLYVKLRWRGEKVDFQ